MDNQEQNSTDTPTPDAPMVDAPDQDTPPEAVAEAEGSPVDPIGVEMGKLCKLHGYTAGEIAEVFKVSRMTVYNWTTGKSQPHKVYLSKMEGLVEHLREKPLPQPNYDE